MRLPGKQSTRLGVHGRGTKLTYTPPIVAAVVVVMVVVAVVKEGEMTMMLFGAIRAVQTV